MIQILPPYFVHNDDRGNITGLIQSGNWKELNLVTSKKGTRRGDHYHKETTELFIILDGQINLRFNEAKNSNRSGQMMFFPGEAFIITPGVFHTFEVVKDSRWINALDRVIKDDMYKRE